MDVGNSVTATDVSNKIVSPSHRVPPEIVAEIIHELLPTDIDWDTQMQKRLNVLFTATSICRYWRYAAVDHATLWSVVPMDHRYLGELFLQRSRNAPLSVTFEAKTRKCYPAHQAIVSLLPHIQRIEKVHFCASGTVLDEVFSNLNRFTRGGQLKEISVHVEGRELNLDLLLEHASTLKVLRAHIPGYHFDHKLRRFSHLTHLELLTTHDIRDVVSLLISLPALTSTKVCVDAALMGGDKHRTLLPINLRRIHLRIACGVINRVLDVLKIAAGVHLKCEVLGVHFSPITRHFALAPEFFENMSHIEELRISLPLCSGSGPSGSFCVEWNIIGGFQPPIEDFSLLRKLVVAGTIDQWTLESVMRPAPRLVSVVFINCAVTKSRTFGRPSKTLASPVDVDVFIKAISKGRSLGTNAGVFDDITVNGSMEGERLEEFKSILEN